MPAPRPPVDFDGYVRDVIRRSCWLAAGLVLASLAWQPGGTSVALGIALGAACSIIAFLRRAQNLVRFINADSPRQKGILMRGRMESYLTIAVAIALAASLEPVHTWAAVASVFTANAVVVFTASRSSGGGAQ